MGQAQQLARPRQSQGWPRQGSETRSSQTKAKPAARPSPDQRCAEGGVSAPQAAGRREVRAKVVRVAPRDRLGRTSDAGRGTHKQHADEDVSKSARLIL